MNIAIFYNSDHPDLGSWYGGSVMRRVLGSGVLQTTNRHMRVSVGDILTYPMTTSGRRKTLSDVIDLCRAVYTPKEVDLLVRDRLAATHGRATVFSWVFQNMTGEIADALHRKLSPDSAYLGAMDVEFSKPLHLSVFRNSLHEAYRLRGARCSIFYSMSENEDPDVAIREIFQEQGFVVDYEDAGARRTIFDNYDTLDHFKRVEDFQRVFGALQGLTLEEASNLAFSLEELHPKVFEALAAAARVLERADTEEELAQSALSGRRLLEQIANYLFPPCAVKWKGRDVGRTQYKNRLWAYIDQTVSEVGTGDPKLLEALGEEADRLVALFNSGLHADTTRRKVEAAFRDLVRWLTRVIELSPAHARKPYLAYEQEIRNMITGVIKENGESENGPH
jgi:phage FluMu protein gp41